MRRASGTRACRLQLLFGDGLPSGRTNDESTLEFRRRFVCFSHEDTKRDSRFCFFPKSSAEGIEFGRVWPQTDSPNSFAHGSQKADRALRDDDVHGGVIQFNPEESVGRERCYRVDASAERSPEMIRVQCHGRFDNEAVFIVRHYAQSHRARDRDLFVQKSLRGA